MHTSEEPSRSQLRPQQPVRCPEPQLTDRIHDIMSSTHQVEDWCTAAFRNYGSPNILSLIFACFRLRTCRGRMVLQAMSQFPPSRLPSVRPAVQLHLLSRQNGVTVLYSVAGRCCTSPVIPVWYYFVLPSPDIAAIEFILRSKLQIAWLRLRTL